MAERSNSRSGKTAGIKKPKRSNDLLFFAKHDPEPAFRFNCDGIIVAANKAGEKMLQLNPEDLQAAKIFPHLQGLNFEKCITDGSTLQFSSEMNNNHYDVSVIGIPEAYSGLIYCSNITDIIKNENDLKRTVNNLQGLSKHSHIAEEIEKQKLSRELHDNTGQILTSIKLQLELMKGKNPEETSRIEQIAELLETAMKQVRGLSYALKPRVLDDLGLIPALNLLCTETTNNTGIKNVFQAHNFKGRIALPLEIGLYRIATEAISNIEEHSGASEFTVQLFQEDNQVRMMIEDDGKGFDVQKIRADKRKTGLLNMEERSLSFGGICHIDSNEGSGTTITVELPLEGIE